MRHASLFSGVGGFDLAASWCGWTNVFQVEKDPFCQTILRRHFPETKLYGDIHEFDAQPYLGQIDVLSGGFPCQPHSHIGKQLGKDDPRHLWPQMLRVIGEARPRFVLGENVEGLVSNGGLDDVCADLEGEGYKVGTLVLPACSVGAPHRRNRVWILANAPASKLVELPRAIDPAPPLCLSRDLRSKGLHLWDEAPPPFTDRCGMDDGLPRWLDGKPVWAHRCQALGNAVVPQIPYLLFRSLEAGLACNCT